MEVRVRSPLGTFVTVDGETNPTLGGLTYNWLPGSSHTIGTDSPQSPFQGSTRYIWNSWSDGGGMSHSVTAPASAATYQANFTTQYLLTASSTLGHYRRNGLTDAEIREHFARQRQTAAGCGPGDPIDENELYRR